MITKILLRASKTPFENYNNTEIPIKHLMAVHKTLNKSGTKNVGNLLFACAVYKTLSAPNTNLDVDYYESTCHDEYINKSEEINEKFHAFVIPLCNMFRIPYQDDFNEKKYLTRLTNLIKKLKIPCIVTGVGIQIYNLNGSFDELQSIDNNVFKFVSAVLDHSKTIGVRGEITKDYLISLGFKTNDIDIIGCPSMFYYGYKINIKKEKKLTNITISLSPVPQNNYNKIIQVASYFNSNYKNVTYIPQLRQLMPFVANKKIPRKKINFSEPPYGFIPNLFINNRIKFFRDVVPWINFMKTQSFTIGTRIHGNIVSLLAGTPCHVIVHDCRTLELCKYFEIPHTLITNLQDINIETIYNSSDFTNLQKNHKQRLDTYANFLEKNGLSHILYNQSEMDSYDKKIEESLQNTLIK